MEMCLNRRGHGFFDTPSPPDATANNVLRNAKANSPIRDAQSYTVKLDKLVLCCVSSLLFPRRPSAIAGLIIAVIVDSVYRVMSAWTRPHICKKGVERIFPSLTDGYSPSSVVLPLRKSRICAPSNYSPPCFMFRVFTKPMCRHPFACHVATVAPAGLSVSGSHGGDGNDLLCSTVTPGANHAAIVHYPQVFHDYKSAVPGSDFRYDGVRHERVTSVCVQSRDPVLQHRLGSLILAYLTYPIQLFFIRNWRDDAARRGVRPIIHIDEVR